MLKIKETSYISKLAAVSSVFSIVQVESCD